MTLGRLSFLMAFSNQFLFYKEYKSDNEISQGLHPNILNLYSL